MRSSYVTLQSEIPNYNTDWLQVSALTRDTKRFDLIRAGTAAEPFCNHISASNHLLHIPPAWTLKKPHVLATQWVFVGHAVPTTKRDDFPPQIYISLVFVVAHECVYCAVRPDNMAAGVEMGGRRRSSWTCDVSKVVHEIGDLARRTLKRGFNPLAPELFFFLISAHPVYKMWIIQEPKKLALWNKLQFEEKKRRV